ncbi:MAG: tripartite tricarboxylate transporter TctB family protein [Peptococcaceae bacterium]|nr:tripartite tricarboxylate transporter TctB family protein [Peptococcaceae bacterium]
MGHDRKSAVVLICLALFVFVNAWRIPRAALQYEIGAGIFPMFLATILGFLSILLFITAGKKSKSLEDAPEEAASVQSDVEKIQEPIANRVKRIVKGLVVLGVYLVLLPYLGFIIDTILFGIGYLMLLYGFRFLKTLVPAVAMAVLGFLIFEIALRIPLPMFMETFR